MPEINRPDPERLLKQIQQESEEKRLNPKGKLKIFLGYCAGVGKTYRMLQEANLKKKSNIDIVIGIVETHGRKETEALTENLEFIPRKQIEYSGINLEEMDLDISLKRKPDIILVDELAHTNAPGSRHSKRYQDIEELLESGINVYTTLNIQHVESLIDIVLQISNVKVGETVPDRILELADEVELVDLAPEKLLERLKEGKVYIPQKAEQAMQKFFQKGNLLALREIALRYTAKQVDEAMRSYMQKSSILGPWPAGSRLLVGISASPTSEVLIRQTCRMAKELSAEWYAVHVESPQQLKINEILYNQLEKNIRLAEELGAEVVYLSGNVIADELIKFAREKNVTLMIAGLSHRSRLEEIIKGSVLNKLVKQCAPINVLIVSSDNKFQKTTTFNFKKKDYRSYIASLLLVVLTVSISWLFRGIIDPTNFGMLLMLPAIASGILWGTRVGLFASLISVAAFDFFFIPPYLTFRISDLKYMPSFGVFIAVCVVISILSNIIRWQIEISKNRERFIASLYGFSREIMSSSTLEDILYRANKHIAEAFDCKVVILIANTKKNLLNLGMTEDNILEDNEFAIAHWVYQNAKAAGKYTNTLSKSDWYYIPLITDDKTIGVLGIKTQNSNQLLSSEQLRLIQSFANVIALAIQKYIELN